ncbi:hypothetical protein HDU87_005541 [Geranomyces variabilis]|uniref:Uncharacterized protein n=1 Tax=Geranomyces variabilis TaxID=109894 RepID=A0AAD5THU7_9FUNG|nr:hypothetical protein HDU87_005541 [Geranomyces variabilis]
MLIRGSEQHCIGLKDKAHLAFPAAVGGDPNGLLPHVKQRCDEYREDARRVAGDAGADERMFWRMMCGSLWQAWEKLTPDSNVGLENHERSAWVDHVIGWFSPLRLTKLVSWRWCEYSYDARIFSQQTKEGYAAASKKYGDALGRDPTTQKERILMESSSGLDKEDLEHTIGDSLKLIENAVMGLRHEMAENKNASAASMTKRMVMTVQAVRDVLTLSYACIGADGKWEILEVRSAKIPRT